MDTAPRPRQPAAAAPSEFRPDPAGGRLFATARRVRSTDVTPAGRLRLDALARYLQDAAEDDVADSGWAEPCGWLLRRCSVAIRGYPAFGEQVTLRTFCSALGPRWAERTTTVAGPGGDLMQACAVWVAVDPQSGQPRPLGPGFGAVYGEAAAGRTVSARLWHPVPDMAGEGRDWPLRAADFDTAGHVNNSVHWAAVEDLLSAGSWLPSAAEMEYHRPILPGRTASLVTSGDGGGLRAWLLEDGQRLASALLTR